MKRVAGYARVSTASQASDGTSLVEQKRKIEDMCRREGYDLVGFYSDGGVSGGSTQRPELRRLIKDAKDGRFDTVLFTKLDRLGRSLRDICNLYHELNEELHLELVSIDDPTINTRGPMGKALIGLVAIFAEFERAMIRERTVAGRKSKWEGGSAIIGDIPYGYREANSRAIEIDTEQAAVYRRIVECISSNAYPRKDSRTANGGRNSSTVSGKGKGQQTPNKHWGEPNRRHAPERSLQGRGPVQPESSCNEACGAQGLVLLRNQGIQARKPVGYRKAPCADFRRPVAPDTGQDGEPED